jgi:hypothetical protein
MLPPEPPQGSLGGAILANAAHLRLESSTLGDLALHLRVRDGVAHVRLEGEQAPQLAQRAPELQRALAAEGLQLGRLEVERPAVHAPADAPRTAGDQTPSSGQQQGQQERDEQPPERAQAAPSPSPRHLSSRASAHHVEA